MTGPQLAVHTRVEIASVASIRVGPPHLGHSMLTERMAFSGVSEMYGPRCVFTGVVMVWVSSMGV